MTRILLVLLFLFFFIYPSVVSAAPCNAAAGECPAGPQQLEDLFTNIVSSAVYLAFIALFIMLIVAGIKYLTSGGEQKAIASAHQTATWAIIGLLFLAISWIVLQLLAVFTGMDYLTAFNAKTLCTIGGVGTNWCN